MQKDCPNVVVSLPVVPADEFESLHSAVQELECYSCGSLLFPDQQCEQFNASDPSQRETCQQDEACLFYSWKKSNSERGETIDIVQERMNFF